MPKVLVIGSDERGRAALQQSLRGECDLTFVPSARPGEIALRDADLVVHYVPSGKEVGAEAVRAATTMVEAYERGMAFLLAVDCRIKVPENEAVAVLLAEASRRKVTRTACVGTTDLESKITQLLEVQLAQGVQPL